MMDYKTLTTYAEWFEFFLRDQGVPDYWASVINTLLLLVAVLMVLIILDVIIRKVVVQGFKAFSNKSKTTFDDFLAASNFPRYIAHTIPLAILWSVIPVIFRDYPGINKAFDILVIGYLVILCILIYRSILRTITNYLRETNEKYADKPLESYQQVMMIFAWATGIFFLVHLLTGYTLQSVATFGALSAVILLIFKDTLLGFVASIQISVNDIVHIGDWITFSKFGADGYVTEINLATVRVQNFDNTYTTIPTYSLISDSFQNWRGMQESPGRRIKRSIFIKQTSIKFLTQQELDELKKIQLIKPYIEHREKDVMSYNKKTEADKSLLINGRNQTNLGIFRKYADAILHENPAINKNLFLMVRHLAPTDKGIPIEIFCFSYDKTWENYEHIQADIFDHLLASIPYFGLEIHESPTGKDISQISIKAE